MSENLSDKSCSVFTAQLASSAPVPGGGGAAALIGSLAASLAAMAANLTLGKKKFAAYEADHRRIIEECEALRRSLLALIDADAENFEPLSRAYSSGDPELLRTATLNACLAPFEIMRCCRRLVELLEELRGKCSVLLLSDVGCAAVSAGAALEAAAMNVFVNTRMLPEDPDAADIGRQALGMLEEFLPRAQALAGDVMTFLKTPKNA